MDSNNIQVCSNPDRQTSRHPIYSPHQASARVWRKYRINSRTAAITLHELKVSGEVVFTSGGNLQWFTDRHTDTHKSDLLEQQPQRGGCSKNYDQLANASVYHLLILFSNFQAIQTFATLWGKCQFLLNYFFQIANVSATYVYFSAFHPVVSKPWVYSQYWPLCILTV